MIKKTFIYVVGAHHDHYFDKAAALAATVGASFCGSSKGGSFNHRGIRGSFMVEEGIVTVELVKPIGVPWGPVERALENFFDQEMQP